MTAHSALVGSVSTVQGPVHLTLTATQALGLTALANDAAPRIDAILDTPAERTAAERGLYRLRAAVQGLRPNDADHDLEHLGEALADVRHADAADLFAARARDLLEAVQLWAAVEHVHRDAIRDDLPHAARAERLLHPELLTTAHWRLDTLALLRAVDAPLPPSCR